MKNIRLNALISEVIFTIYFRQERKNIFNITILFLLRYVIRVRITSDTQNMCVIHN